MEFLSSITIQAHLILINSWWYPILWIKELTPRTSYLDSPCHPMQFCPLKWISLPQPRAGKWWHRHCRGREGENCSLCTPLAAKIVCRWEGISLGMHGAQLNHLIFSFTDTCSHMFYELRFPFQTFRYFLQKYNNLEIWPDTDRYADTCHSMCWSMTYKIKLICVFSIFLVTKILKKSWLWLY